MYGEESFEFGGFKVLGWGLGAQASGSCIDEHIIREARVCRPYTVGTR